MSTPNKNADEPFFSLRNIPLWVGVFLVLVFAGLAIAKHQPDTRAAEPAPAVAAVP